MQRIIINKKWETPEVSLLFPQFTALNVLQVVEWGAGIKTELGDFLL